MNYNISYDKEKIRLDLRIVDDITDTKEYRINKLRDLLDNIDVDTWKNVRHYINNYDFEVNPPIINRAFFKYWEIIYEFDIFKKYNDEYILHCCEAPGGFIQGTNMLVKKEKANKEYDEDGFEIVKKKINKKKIWTISLNKSLSQYRNYNLPSYNKIALNSNVKVVYGEDDTGDITNWENIEYIKKTSNEKFYLITADGGFDERSDFNNKEVLHYRLILSEIYTAIKLQKKGGVFILKMFDIYTESNYQLLYLLSQCYKQVFIYKPLTSRPTNSEKYIICRDFRICENEREYIISELSKFYKENFVNYEIFTLFEKIPEDFRKTITYVNEKILENQVENLELAIKLCNDKEFIKNYNKGNHINYYKEWCLKYKL